MPDFYGTPLPDSDDEKKQERERRKLALAEAELRAQLNGQAPGFGGAATPASSCPTQARERHQQRLATIKALCDAVKALAQDL